MRYKTVRVKPGDKIHLAILARQRRSTMIDTLAALVAQAEAGSIYPPLCEKRRSSMSNR